MINCISHKRRQRQVRVNERSLSCAFLASSPQKTPDCLARDAIGSGNLAKGFVVFKDTAHHVRPFFRWDGMVRLTWTWMLLCGDDRGNTTQGLLEGTKALIELAVWGKKVDQHW
jgi:hypothetical protein